MGRKKGISAKQRRRWALSAVRREDSMVSLSREAGVTEQTLYRWRDMFIKGGCERLSGGESPEREEIERLKKELAERAQVVCEQTIATRVLKKLGKLTLTVGFKADVMDDLSPATAKGKASLIGVLRSLGIAPSSWYRPPNHGKRGPKPRPVAPEKASEIVEFSCRYPQWGHQRLMFVFRRFSKHQVTKYQIYKVMSAEGLLRRQKPVRQARIHQCAKLFELLLSRPDDLWQSDVTWIHIPGFNWWYVATVIDYYSRYLLACHLTSSQSTHDAVAALEEAREAAHHGGFSGRVPRLVTDNGGCSMSRKFHDYASQHFNHVRIQYRTPAQLGLLKRFHGTLKDEEVYWNLYDSPADASRSLAAYQERYNQICPHWALQPVGGEGPLVPADVYLDGLAVTIPKWQGWVQAARNKLLEMTGELTNSDRNDNQDILSELSMEIK